MAEVPTKDVPLPIVLQVLEQSALVDITASPTGEAVRVTIVRRNADPSTSNPGVYYLTDLVRRGMLYKFHRAYGIPVHWFWNPSMVKKVGT